MPANRRRYAQAFPLAYTLIVIGILASAATFAIKALLITQEVRQDHERIGKLTKERYALERKVRELEADKQKLIASPALRAEVGAKKLPGYVPIDERYVILVGRMGVASADAGVVTEGGY